MEQIALGLAVALATGATTFYAIKYVLIRRARALRAIRRRYPNAHHYVVGIGWLTEDGRRVDVAEAQDKAQAVLDDIAARAYARRTQSSDS